MCVVAEDTKGCASPAIFCNPSRWEPRGGRHGDSPVASGQRLVAETDRHFLTAAFRPTTKDLEVFWNRWGLSQFGRPALRGRDANGAVPIAERGPGADGRSVADTRLPRKKSSWQQREGFT